MGPDFQTSQLRYKATSSDNQRGGCWHEQGLVQTSDWVQAHWPWNKAVTVKSQVGRQNVRLWDTQNLSRFGIVWPTHFRKLVLSCPSTSIPNRCSVSGLLNISRNGDFGVGQIPPPESQKPAVGMLEEYPHAAFIQTSNVKCWESRTSHASVHIIRSLGLLISSHLPKNLKICKFLVCPHISSNKLHRSFAPLRQGTPPWWLREH